MLQNKPFTFTIQSITIAIFLTIIGFSEASANNISDHQIKILAKFRELVDDGSLQDYQKVESYLVRWLKAKNWNLDDAAKYFKEGQQWRKENNVDSILNETVLEFPQPPYTVDTVDYEGRPVLISSLLNLRSLTLKGKKNKLARYQIQAYERLALRQLELSAIYRKDISQVITIIDLQGFSIKEQGLDVFRQWDTVEKTFYPGWLKFKNVQTLAPVIARALLDTLRVLLPTHIQVLKLYTYSGQTRTNGKNFYSALFQPINFLTSWAERSNKRVQ